MGVISCDRNGCENVMSARYSHEHGDLCNECFTELVNRRTLDFEGFMETEKVSDTYQVDYESICGSVFKLRD